MLFNGLWERRALVASRIIAFIWCSKYTTGSFEGELIKPSEELVDFIHFVIVNHASAVVISVALFYMALLKAKRPNAIDESNSCAAKLMFLFALVVSRKNTEDSLYMNKTWTEILDIELKELNNYEREFMCSIDYELYISRPTYNEWVENLKKLNDEYDEIEEKEADSEGGSTTKLGIPKRRLEQTA